HAAHAAHHGHHHAHVAAQVALLAAAHHHHAAAHAHHSHLAHLAHLPELAELPLLAGLALQAGLVRLRDDLGLVLPRAAVENVINGTRCGFHRKLAKGLSRSTTAEKKDRREYKGCPSPVHHILLHEYSLVGCRRSCRHVSCFPNAVSSRKEIAEPRPLWPSARSSQGKTQSNR